MEFWIKAMVIATLIGIVISVVCTYTVLCAGICEKNGILDAIIDRKFKMKFKYILLIPGILMIKVIEYFEG